MQKNTRESIFRDILQRKAFHDVTYNISCNDRDSSSGISSQEHISRADTIEELREIRRKCEDLQKHFWQETETESEYFHSCVEKIQKLIDRTGYDIRDLIDNAKVVLRSSKNIGIERAVGREVINTSLAIMDDVKSNTQYYLDQLGISAAGVLTQIFGSSNNNHGSMNKVQGLIQKLEVNESKNSIHLLEAAQKKVSSNYPTHSIFIRPLVFFSVLQSTLKLNPIYQFKQKGLCFYIIRTQKIN